METTKWIRRNDKFKFSRDRESSYRVFYSGGYRTFLLQRDLAERKVEFTFSAKFHEERGGKKKKTRFIYIYRNKTRYAYSFRDYLSRVLPEWQSSIGRTSLDSFCGYSTYIAESLIQ